MAALLGAATFLTAGCLSDPVGRHERARTEAFDLLTDGQQLKRQGDYLLARDTFLRGLAISPRPVLYYEVGNCYYQLERYDEAVSWYNQALQIEPTFVLASAERDLAANRVGPTTTVSTATVSTAATPATSTAATTTTPAAPARGGQQSLSGGGGLFGGLAGALAASSAEDEPTEAALQVPAPADVRDALFPELLVTHDDPSALENAALAAVEGGRFDEATRHLERLEEAFGLNAEQRSLLAVSYERTGRLRRAEHQLLLALDGDHASQELWYQLGNLLLTMKEEGRAREAFTTALRLDPTHWRALNNRSVIQLSNREYPAALDGFRRVVAIEPDHAPAWLNLALALDGSGAPANQVLEAVEAHIRRLQRVPGGTERWMQQLRARVAAGQ